MGQGEAGAGLEGLGAPTPVFSFSVSLGMEAEVGDIVRRPFGAGALGATAALVFKMVLVTSDTQLFSLKNERTGEMSDPPR